MLDRLLPPAVHWSATRTDVPPAEAGLFPAEAALIARAVDKRRREFTTVRHCARLALAGLGEPPAPILPGTRGAPVWPPGIVGSMTHCDGYRAAAVARAADVAGLGIDAEVHEELPDGVLDLISSPTERTRLATLAASRPDVHWGRLLFSAKESVYKVWSPRTGEWLGFEHAELTIDPVRGTFSARILLPGPFASLAGRYLIEDGLVLTAVVLTPSL